MGTEESIMRIIRKLAKDYHEFTTQQILTHYPVSRSLMSHYLNRLVESGFLSKINTRPVRFKLISDPMNPFQNFIGSSGSLYNQIEKCKSAVIYPPNGLPIIIQGNSGVGKSYLASLIHRYAIKKNVIDQGAPFIVLNCADYANNPDLLSAVLFGYTKGAFTGAEDTKEGLIRDADGGFLFLDEIHRLSFENQEKLFLILDTNRYRRLGDKANWQKSNVRMIFATTEDIDQSLLDTFRRRIPISVKLPDFSERPITERIQVINLFLHNEAKIMGKDIQIEPDWFEQLALQIIEGNIGGLKNKIKVLCADALRRSPNRSCIKIDHLIEKNRSDNKAMDHPIVIHKNSRYVPLNEQNSCINSDLFLSMTSIDFQQMVAQLPVFLNKIDNQEKIKSGLIDLTGFWSIVFNHFYAQVIRMNKLYALQINKREVKLLVLLLAGANQFFQSKGLDFQKLTPQTRKKYYKASLLTEVLKENCAAVWSDLNEELLIIITAFFHWKVGNTYKLSGIILTHGSSASGIAEVANSLCGGYIFEPFNMEINIGNEEIIHSVKKYVEKIDTKNGLVLLVDMGSLEELYEPIKSDLNGDLIIINNVSTAIAIDIGFKIKQNKTIEEIAKSSKNAYKIDLRYYEGIAKGKNIIVSCLSGIGIASKIKEILEPYISPEEYEILTMDYQELKTLIQSGKNSAFKNTKLILTTTNINDPNLSIINVEELVSGTRDLSRFFNMVSPDHYNEIRNKIVKLFSIEGASTRLNFLNPTIIINEVDLLIKRYEDHLDTNFNSFLRMNLLLHIPLMIERVIVGHSYTKDDPKGQSSDSVEDFINLSKNIFHPILEKYNILIPDGEYILIHDIIFEELNK